MDSNLKCAVHDGRICSTIVDADVPDLWMNHMRLSVNLEMLQTTWRDVKKGHTTRGHHAESL